MRHSEVEPPSIFSFCLSLSLSLFSPSLSRWSENSFFFFGLTRSQMVSLYPSWGGRGVSPYYSAGKKDTECGAPARLTNWLSGSPSLSSKAKQACSEGGGGGSVQTTV